MNSNIIKYSSILVLFLGVTNSYAQLEKDKALHFLGGNLYGLVGGGIANQISDGNRTWTFFGSLGGSLLVGLAKESIDKKQYDGWDNDDLLATVLGGATVGVTIDLFKKKKQKKKEKLYQEAIGRTITIKKIPSNTKNLDSLALLGISSTAIYTE